MTKKRYIFSIIILFILLLVSIVCYLAYPFLNARNNLKDYQISKGAKPEAFTVFEPSEFFLTRFNNLTDSEFVLIDHRATIEKRKERGEEGDISVIYYNFTRNNIFELSWKIEKVSASIVSKPFDQVVELAKKTDIGMINRKIIDYDNGDNCKPIEGQPGMNNCRKAETDEGYDPDISTYVPKTKEQEEISRKQDEEMDRIIKESELTRPTPAVYEPGDVRLNKEVKDMATRIGEEGSNTRLTPERIEQIYIEFKELFNSYPPEKSKNIDEALKELQSVFQLDENGKYIGRRITPTPPTPIVLSIAYEKDVMEYGERIVNETSDGNFTKEENERLYAGLLSIVEKYPAQVYKDKEKFLSTMREYLQLDANGKYVGPSPKPTPAEN